MKDLEKIDLEGQKVLLRTDLNLPIKDGRPEKALRFERYAESIKQISEKGAKTVVLAHQGRPGREDFTSLKQHKNLLEDELENEIFFVESFMGSELEETLDEMESGDIALMENVRLLSEELKNMSGEKHAEGLYANHLADCFDLYVNDAFSVAHRSHASIVGFPELLESIKGPVMESEIANCGKVRDEMDSEVLVLGGQKPSDLIGIMESNIESADKILLTGVPAELALMIQGHDLGEKQKWIRKKGLDKAQADLAELMEEHPGKFETPEDLKTQEGSETVGDLSGGMIWDIGLKTAQKYAEIIEDAEAVLMKGPAGAYEKHPEGSKTIIKAIAESEAFTVLGGGHTSSLVEEFGYSIDDFSHVSIAGGAFVKFVSGERLPGIEALEN